MRASERLGALIAQIPRIDYRRRSVYDWETRNIKTAKRVYDSDNSISLLKADHLARACCETLGISTIQGILLEESRVAPEVAYFRRELWLGPPNLQPSVVMHEIAHLSVMSKAHSDKWAARYIELLFRHGDMSLSQLWRPYRGEVRAA